MVALVTGATGFLGSHLARLLCQRGDKVRVLMRATSKRERLAGLALEEAEGDVTDRASVERAVDGADAVYHCAARYEFGTADPDAMARVNVGGTENVLEAAGRNSVVVHVSSVAALGPTGPDAVDESHWNDGAPRSTYEATKRKAHLLARQHAAQGGRVRIASPGGIYGPDDPSVLGMMTRLLARYPVPLGATAHVRQAYVHVDDCAEGLIRIADRGQDGGEYLLCADLVTFRQWLETMARATRRRPPFAYVPDWVVRAIAPAAAWLAPLFGGSSGTVSEVLAMATSGHMAFSGDRARRELGWSPRPLAEGLAELVAATRR